MVFLLQKPKWTKTAAPIGVWFAVCDDFFFFFLIWNEKVLHENSDFWFHRSSSNTDQRDPSRHEFESPGPNKALSHQCLSPRPTFLGSHLSSQSRGVIRGSLLKAPTSPWLLSAKMAFDSSPGAGRMQWQKMWCTFLMASLANYHPARNVLSESTCFIYPLIWWCLATLWASCSILQNTRIGKQEPPTPDQPLFTM